jgi:hypothetical protein
VVLIFDAIIGSQVRIGIALFINKGFAPAKGLPNKSAFNFITG